MSNIFLKKVKTIVLDVSYLRNPLQISFSQISKSLSDRTNKIKNLTLIKVDS